MISDGKRRRHRPELPGSSSSRAARAVTVVLSTAIALVSTEVLLQATVGPPARLLHSGTFRDVQSDWDVTYGASPTGARTTCSAPRMVDLRIAVIGDSFVYGQGVEDCHDFVSLLAQRMPTVRFENLGVIGAGIETYIAMARDFVTSEYDQVILVFFGNDITAAGRARSPLGVLADDTMTIGLVRRAHRAWTSSRAARAAARGESDMRIRRVDGRPNNTLSLLTNTPDYFHAMVEPDASDVARFRQRFRTLAALLTSRVRPENILVTMVPQGHVVSHRLAAFIGSHGGSLATFGRPGTAYGIVRSLAAHHGFRFVESFEDFLEAGDSSYYARDPHWTSAGHERMATILEPAIVQAAGSVG